MDVVIVIRHRIAFYWFSLHTGLSFRDLSFCYVYCETSFVREMKGVKLCDNFFKTVRAFLVNDSFKHLFNYLISFN